MLKVIQEKDNSQVRLQLAAVIREPFQGRDQQGTDAEHACDQPGEQDQQPGNQTASARVSLAGAEHVQGERNNEHTESDLEPAAVERAQQEYTGDHGKHDHKPDCKTEPGLNPLVVPERIDQIGRQVQEQVNRGNDGVVRKEGHDATVHKSISKPGNSLGKKS